jgi:hypothetical protein
METAENFGWNIVTNGQYLAEIIKGKAAKLLMIIFA